MHSALGVAVALTVNGQQVTFSSMTTDTVGAVIASSLQIPLGALSAHLDGQVVFYAATPGALVDLAADLRHALHLSDTQVHLDEHLGLTGVSEVTGARELSTINRAIGFLMDRGHTPETAQQHVTHQAATTNSTLHQAAQNLLTTRTQPSD